jgi:hypothetical protein
LCILFILESSIEIPNEMVAYVIANMHFLQLAVFSELAEKVFIEGVEMLLDLLGVESVSRVVHRILVDVSAEDGLRVVWFDVFSGAVVAMTAGTYFVVEGTIDLVCLCSVYSSELAGHDVKRVDEGEDANEDSVIRVNERTSRSRRKDLGCAP